MSTMRFSLQLAAAALIPMFLAAPAAASANFLDTLKKNTTLGSTIPSNGDVNPYALFVAPVSAGKFKKDDVLVDNFNDKNNLQGVGTTIVDFSPSTKTTTLFASVPKTLPACPGGVGLTTAMAVLKSGYVIVGSQPSTDGTFKTAGPGCLIVFDANGKFVTAFSGGHIDGPWGNMAIVDHGKSATLFISQIGAGKVPSGTQAGKLASVIRVSLVIGKEGPKVKNETVIGDGFAERADKDVFVIGPTGLVLEGDTLYVSDALANAVEAIPHALTRQTSAGTGALISKDGSFKRPLALEKAPNGHLLVINGLDGEIIELDPVSKKQIASHWLNNNKAQTPPGSGDLFGVALTPDGKGLYFVNDDVNTLAVAR
jgi:DNA-binding beta-propeller fold protein YncE